MSEALNPFPDILKTKVSTWRVALLLEMGDPYSIDRAAAQTIVEGNGIFDANLTTDPNNPEGAIYKIEALDAGVIANRGLLSHLERTKTPDGALPEAVDEPEDPDHIAPTIVTWALVGQTDESPIEPDELGGLAKAPTGQRIINPTFNENTGEFSGGLYFAPPDLLAKWTHQR